MFASAFSLKRPEGVLLRLALPGLCLLVLSACAATRPSVDLPDLTTWELRQEVLGSIPDWEFRGRIAVKAGDEGFNGKLSWTQTGNHFYATVSGPLGIGTVVMEGTDKAIVLTHEDGSKQALIDPEVELYDRYGWAIPVASLRYWALGIPDPSTPFDMDIDAAGRLVNLEQSNWVVNISRYRESAGQQMPRILTATNPNTRVRMVMDKWIFFER